MGQRLDFQTLLEEICDHVYFQPPINEKIVYPCIIYKKDFTSSQFADNVLYKNKTRYLVTVIDRNPDSEIPKNVAKLPLSLFNRFYIAESLNHDAFHVYF